MLHRLSVSQGASEVEEGSVAQVIPYRAQATNAEGLLEVSRAPGGSAVTRARASSPMKLLVPRTRSEVARVSVGTYGGGMLAGDETRLRAHLRSVQPYKRAQHRSSEAHRKGTR